MEDPWLCSLIDLPSKLSIFAQTGKPVSTVVNGNSILGEFLVVFILLLINGFFAASEMAVVSANDNKILGEAERGNKKAKLLLRFIEDSGNFLSVIQVGITFAGFLSSSFAGESFAGRLAEVIQPNGPSDVVYTLSLVLVTLIISYLSIVVGEMVPKQIALANPEKFALSVVSILRGIEIIFKPITWMINKSVNLLLRLFKIDPEANQDVASEEEIRMILDQGKRSGSILDTESEMIVNIFEFDDKEVSEIMTHRTNVFALDIDLSLQEVINAVVHEKYSRIPVYEDDIDNIIGTLHLKDLLYYLTTNNDPNNNDQFSNSELSDNFDFRKIIRQAYWVPESKHTNELLQEMQNNHVSIAVVVDEYGGTAGIVTIEDLLEEIVGNIQDEYDEEDFGIHKVGKNKYQVSGMATPEEIMRVLPQAYFPDDSEDKEYDYDTIAGLILALLGRIPDDDEQVEVAYKNMIFRVLSMDDKRIDKIELEIISSARKYLEDERKREEEEKIRAEEEREKLRQELYDVKSGDKDEDNFDDLDFDAEQD